MYNCTYNCDILEPAQHWVSSVDYKNNLHDDQVQ